MHVTVHQTAVFNAVFELKTILNFTGKGSDNQSDEKTAYL